MRPSTRIQIAGVLIAAWAAATAAPAAQNRSEDEYTRYELLAPETASFKIIYDVTAVTPGAKYFFNPIRIGSVATDESVIDLMTGAPLKFQEVSGAEARESGLANAALEDVHPRRAGASGAGRRRGPHPHHQDLQGSQELLPRRRRPRLRSSAGDQAQRRRAAGRLRDRLVQHPLTGDRRERRPDRYQLHEHVSGAGAARPPRGGDSPPGCGRRAGRSRCPNHEADRRRPRAAAAADGACPRVGARVPGSRDRLLPEEPRDALVQPVSRLHRNPSGNRPLRQRRPRRKRGF